MKPIYFSDATNQWLESLEWPESAYADFNQIAKHNEKYERIKAAQPAR